MNHSIGSVLIKGAEILKKSKIANFKQEANELLESLLNRSPEEIFLSKGKSLSNKLQEAFFKRIGRREVGEPLQYITKVAHFYSRKFTITKGALIPRQETEILVEKVLKLIDGKKNIRCLDMCTGSGCIGITLGLENKQFKKIFLVDSSKKALECCKKNVEIFGLEKTTILILSNLFSLVPKIKFDVICANPPYVKEDDFHSLDRTVREHEPKAALVSKKNGFFHIEKIAIEAQSFLKKDGILVFEVGVNQAQEVKKILIKIGYSSLVIYNDLNKIERVVMAKWKK
jgi:release factor glutamine methyltransferase|tara:strand:- start:22462 stop:23319 length:858 start_codon:yes stop_codon:yes gene_type:complete